MANPIESTHIYRMGTAPNTRTAVSQKNKIYSYTVGKNKFQHLGAVTQFDLSESRTIDVTRGVGMGDQIAELVPGVTSEMSLTVNATLLYALNLFQMMGYKGGVDGLVRSLKHHRWPFDIKQELVFSYIASSDTDNAPGFETSGFKPATTPSAGGAFLSIEPNIKALFTFFEGCWFENYSTSFSSEAGVVSNDSSIKVSDVVDGVSLYGEYINTGLTPDAEGNSAGKGSSIRFAGNSAQNANSLLLSEV